LEQDLVLELHLLDFHLVSEECLLALEEWEECHPVLVEWVEWAEWEEECPILK
jgi:hypothetical protein